MHAVGRSAERTGMSNSNFIPLAFGMGDGGELRQPLGVAIVGGLLLRQLLTLYTTPVIYLYLDGVSLWLRGGGGVPDPTLLPGE
jgi:multidrug efflux pump